MARKRGQGQYAQYLIFQLDCDDLSGQLRIEPDPQLDRRDAFNVICRLDSGVPILDHQPGEQ